MIALISDIHGNHRALLAVLREIEGLGVSAIVCLGDIGGYYCEINECCQTLQDNNVFCLQGNHDWYLATGNPCERSNSANRCIEYQREIISPKNLDWLGELEPKANYRGISVVHGGWQDPLEEYVRPSSEYFSKFSGALFASGHTHVPVVWSDGKRSYCNLGSVGQPRDGNPMASFAIYDGHSFSIKRVSYSCTEVQEKMRAAGFDSYYYENLTLGTRIGGKIDRLEDYS